MKKMLLLIMIITALSCDSDDHATANPIVGKWLIYRAEYENTAYDYEINNQCSVQSLEMAQHYNYVTETYYNDENCRGFTATTSWEWTDEGNGTYHIYDIGQTVPERYLTLTGDVIKVTEPDIITVVKYYKRAM